MVDIFLVDDGSSRTRAEEVLEGWELPVWGPTLQLLRCSRDLGFKSKPIASDMLIALNVLDILRDFTFTPIPTREAVSYTHLTLPTNREV